MSQSFVLYLGSLLVRSIGIAVIAGVCTWKMRDVAKRHAVWVAVLGAMLSMPVLDYLLPAQWVPNRIQRIVVEPAVVSPLVVLQSGGMTPSKHPLPSITPSPGFAAAQFDWWKAVAAGYASVSFAMLLLLVMAYRKVWNLRRSGSPISSYLWDELIFSSRIKWRVPVLLESETVRVPMTIGFLKPVVLLPAGWRSWDESKLMAVLSHEFAHVRRADWVIAALAAAAKCAYWMNPLSWFLERKLSVLAEQASDDAAILSTRDTARYAEILLEFAATAGNSGRYFQGGVPMAQHSTRARIERVLSNQWSGTGILTVARWVLVLILATPVLYSAAALQVSGRTPVPIAKVGPLTASPQPRLLPAEVPPTALALPSRPPQATVQNLLRHEPQPVQPPLRASQQPDPDDIIRLALSRSTSGTAYVIKAGDSLNISVWKQPDVSTKVTVQPDGRISIPLVQDILAAGSTLVQLKGEVERRLQDKIQMPEVTVILESTSSYRVYVVGQVEKPGELRSERALTVLQALSLAGAFTSFARKDEITIVRSGESPEETRRFLFNYSNVINGRDVLANMNLRSGDVVVVP